jgi:hypothetical protein
MKLYKDQHNHWVEFEPEVEKDGRSLEVSAFAEDVVFSVFGPTYKDRDNYTVTPDLEYPLNLDEVKILRDFLNDAIEAMEKAKENVE